LPDTSPPGELAKARQLLAEGCATLGIHVSEFQTEAFLSYLSLILLWNRTFNLTSVRDPVAIVRLHFLDSLAIARFVDKAGPIMDIGSGAGFPGLPLAIMYPTTAVTLVEPRRKRANFLREVARAVRASKVVVVEDRVERLYPTAVGLFSTILLRAVGRPEFFLRTARPFLNDGGKCLILHGPTGSRTFSSIQNNLSTLGYANVQIENYRIPAGNEERIVISASG